MINDGIHVVGIAKEEAKQDGGENAVLCVQEIKRLFDQYKTSGVVTNA